MRDFDKNGIYKYISSRLDVELDRMSLFRSWDGLDGHDGNHNDERCAQISSAINVYDIPCTDSHYGLCELAVCINAGS